MHLQTIMSLDDLERHAYASGDLATVALIHRAEEDAADAFAESMTPEHEEAVDNLNAASKALQACVDAMTEADIALTLRDDDDTSEFTLPKSYADALSDAEDALKAPSLSYDHTLREKLHKAESERDSMRGQLAAAHSELQARSHVFYTAEALLRPYKAKKSPRWADTLRKAVNAHRGPQGLRYS